MFYLELNHIIYGKMNRIIRQAFYPICTHGSESVNDNMDEILDYILNKDNCECTTYKDVYDQFRSTALENRIKALEEKLYS